MSLFHHRKRNEIPSSDAPMDDLPPAVRGWQTRAWSDPGGAPPSFPRLGAPPVAPREPPQPVVVHVRLDEATRQRLAAVISPAQFRKLADWFDTDDEFKEAMFPETWSPGTRKDEVQQDLRRFADLLEGDTT